MQLRHRWAGKYAECRYGRAELRQPHMFQSEQHKSFYRKLKKTVTFFMQPEQTYGRLDIVISLKTLKTRIMKRTSLIIAVLAIALTRGSARKV